MISRRTAYSLGKLFACHFLGRHYLGQGMWYSCDTEKLYDFLYEHEYEAYLMNIVKQTVRGNDDRPIKEFIMKLHTGETIVSATKDWSWDRRRSLGNRLLQDLAADILTLEPIKGYGGGESHDRAPRLKLISDLELDGYAYKNGRLLYSEASVVDEQEEEGVLQQLIGELKLPDKAVIMHHLEQSSMHYTEGRWDDCIANAEGT